MTVGGAPPTSLPSSPPSAVPQWVQPPSLVLAAGFFNWPLTNLQRHPSSALEFGWEPRVQPWLPSGLGCGSGRHRLGSTWRPPRRASSLALQPEWAWGTEPALCFLAGASLSLASLVCKTGTTTHPPGSCGLCCSPPQRWPLCRLSAWAPMPVTSPEFGCGSDSSFVLR